MALAGKNELMEGRKLRRIAYLALVPLMLLVLFAPMVSAQNGPETDVLRYLVIRSPSAQLLAMQYGQIDVLTQRTNQDHIEDLDYEGFTITSTQGFHICFIGFNIRANQSYRRPEIDFWPLADVNFRHALAHSLNKTEIAAEYGGYVKSPLDSMVPPIYGTWHNPYVDGHPFKLGHPINSPPTEHSTCGLLKAAGYKFQDEWPPLVVDSHDYWLTPFPDESPLPQMNVLSPLEWVDPQKYGVVNEWLQDCSSIGLAGTVDNGFSGLVQQSGQFWGYTQNVYDAGPPSAHFDAFIVNFKLNRFPDYLYDWFHSSQDSRLFPSAYNPFGVNDTLWLNGLLQTLKFGVVHSEKVQACRAAQAWLANASQPQGIPVLPVYTMCYFDAFNSDLRGIVRSPGYGTGDGGCIALKEPDGPIPSIWTYTNIRWATGKERHEDVDDDGFPETVVIWCLGDDPETLNPLYAGTSLAWEIMDRVFDPLITMNPYNHNDVPWVATDWEVEYTLTGMNVTYHLRDDVFWQDGYQYNASHAEFSLEFIRDWQINKYKPAWEPIVDVEVINPTTFRVVSNRRSQFLLYDWAVLATLLPPQIWDRTWPSQAAVLAYSPTAFAYGDDMGDGSYTGHGLYVPGPWADQVPTNLFGTGPWIFQFYDPVTMHSDLWANRNYFMTTANIESLKTEMFWEVGDYNRDGVINVVDLTYVAFAYGTHESDPDYDPDADFNQDGWVNMIDLSTCAYHLLWQKEYP